MAILKIENLIKKYGSCVAVDNISLEVNAGEIYGLLGPNGAGKTSIISTIMTLEKPTSGLITVNGLDITLNNKITKACIGIVPQEIVSHGYFNLEEILVFQSGYYGLLKNTEKIHHLMRQLQLWDHRHKKVRQLSGGMKRRLMIAKALVHSPKLLLLDEPTAGVDVELRDSLWAQIEDLKKNKVAILFTTHYLEEAELLCDRVGIIHKGKLQQQGNTKQLIKKLTSRHITITVKNKIKCTHSTLIKCHNHTLEFRIPYSTEMGKFFSELDCKMDNIIDIKIREGTLEEAFKYVLHKK